MKRIRNAGWFILILILCGSKSFAQESAIRGTVMDSTGSPLEGTTITVLETKVSTLADKNGKFSVKAAKGNTLLFSNINSDSLSVVVDDRFTYDIRLHSRSGALGDVVVVGYGTQKRVNLTGSVASVKSQELTQAPVASTINTLAGRLPGLVFQQSSGRPGGDQASISIRGFGQAIWIVDGVESDFNNIDPNSIETISILKDGAASVYGSRAGNGVVLVTTKRGISGKPVVTLNSSYTLQGITDMAKTASAGQYAELQNEMFVNQGKDAPYTEEQVQKYYSGTDPQYPNTNWTKEVIRDWSPQQQHNLSVRGGSDKVRYFGLFGYLDQDQVWKTNGGYYRRYNVQSNIDAKISDNLSIQLLLSSVLENRKASIRDYYTGGLWGDLWNALPIYPATLPDPTKISYANGNGVGNMKAISDYDIAGANQNNSQNLKGTFIADYKIKPVNGLSARAFFNYQQTYTDNKNFTKPYNFYTYDYSTQAYTLAGALGTQARLVMQDDRAKVLTSQLSLNYDHTIAAAHHITAIALYEAIDYSTSDLQAGRDNFLTPAIEQLYAGAVQTSQATGSATQLGRVGYLGRLNYSYKDKYLLESSIRADASAKFPSNRRWGYFPSVSLGWRLDQERMIQRVAAIDELKLRASYGSSGLDNVGNFQYLTGYTFNGQWLFGSNTQVAIASTGLPNPDLTWETIKIYNAGLDFSLYKGKLFGSADVFYRTLNGIPATRILSLPNTFGATLPQENLNSQNNRGFELVLGTRGNVGAFTYNISGNLSWSRARWKHYEEQDYTDADQKRLYQQSGKWTDQVYGYKSDGLFTSQEEIDKLTFTYPAGNDGLRPGDIRYVDVNGDGKLDYKDQENIGVGTVPHWMVGSSINLKYKSFDLSALLQGAFGYYNYITLLQGNQNYSDIVYKLRWSEKDNSADAFYPRLGGAASNSYTSDHYYRKAQYLRLKTLAIGYSVPRYLLQKLKIQDVRVYVAGTNLYTLNSLKKFGVDPEAPSGSSSIYYPQMRTISLGVNVSF